MKLNKKTLSLAALSFACTTLFPQTSFSFTKDEFMAGYFLCAGKMFQKSTPQGLKFMNSSPLERASACKNILKSTNLPWSSSPEKIDLDEFKSFLEALDKKSDLKNKK